MAPKIPRRPAAVTPDIRVQQPIEPSGVREAQALAAVGKGAIGLGGALAQRQRQLELEKTDADVQGVWNDVYGQLSRFVADEATNKTGNQTAGNIDRYNEKRRELLELSELDPTVRDVLEERLRPFDQRNLDRLSEVQAKGIQQSKVLGIKNAVQEFEDVAATDIGLDINEILDDLEEAIAPGGVDLFGAEQTEAIRMEATENIGLNRIQGMAQIDPEGTLDALKSGEFNDLIVNVEKRDAAVKALETQIRNNKAIGKEKVAQAQESWRESALVQLNDNSLTFENIIDSPLEAKEKEQWAKKLDGFGKRSDRYRQSDSRTYADMSTRVFTAPETVTEAELFDLIGKTGDRWLSTSDVESLVKQRRTQLKEQPDANRTKVTSAILQNFGRDRKNGLFGTGAEGDIEYAKQVRDMLAYAEANPEADLVQYYEQVMGSSRATFIEKAMDVIPFIDAVKDGLRQVTPEEAQERRRAGRAAPAPSTPPRGQLVPTLDVFLKAARKANPGVSDDALTEFYNGKYGR